MTFDVTAHGAAGDGITLDTAALQRVLDTCGNAGGGTVLFPPGRYLSGSLTLHSNTVFRLEAGATLLQSKEMEHYAEPPPRSYVYTTASRYIFLFAQRVENIAIVGEGCIDGQLALDRGRDGYVRGPLTILIENSRNVVMRDVTVRNSPGWSITVWGCRDVEFTRVRCLDGYADGINPSCCQNVHYRDCVIDGSGDDPISIKNEPACAERYGGRFEDGPDCGFLTENILVENTTIRRTTHACLKLGTATFGVMRNITFRNCAFEETGALLSLQMMQPSFPQNPLRRIENLKFENVVSKNPGALVEITSIDAVGPVIQNVEFRNVEVTGVRLPSNIWGLPDAPIRNVVLDEVRVSGVSSPRWLRARWVEGLTVRNSTFDIEGATRGFEFEDSRDIRMEDATITGGSDTDPLIRLHDVHGFSMRKCRTPDVRTLLHARGAGTANIDLDQNHLGSADQLFRVEREIQSVAGPTTANAVRTTGIQCEDRIGAGRGIPVTVSLANDGDTGLHRVSVSANGKEVAGCWWLLKSGESRNFELVTDPVYLPGEYCLTADGRETTTQIVSTPAEFTYGERMEISAPTAAGALTMVRVTVMNRGGEAGVVTVELEADDRVVIAERVPLGPGEKKAVTFEHRFAGPGPRRLRAGDFPVWPYATFANTEARFFQTQDKIIIEAGGGRNDIRDSNREYAAVYLPVEGDFEAETRYLLDLVTGPYCGGGILVKNDMTRPEDDAGCVLSHRFPKYDIPTYENPMPARVVRRGNEFECDPLVSPDTAATKMDVGIFATAFSGKGEKITVEFEGFRMGTER